MGILNIDFDAYKKSLTPESIISLFAQIGVEAVKKESVGFSSEDNEVGSLRKKVKISLSKEEAEMYQEEHIFGNDEINLDRTRINGRLVHVNPIQNNKIGELSSSNDFGELKTNLQQTVVVTDRALGVAA